MCGPKSELKYFCVPSGHCRLLQCDFFFLNAHFCPGCHLITEPSGWLALRRACSSQTLVLQTDAPGRGTGSWGPPGWCSAPAVGADHQHPRAFCNTQQPDLVSATCPLPCALPRRLVHACAFCFDLFSLHAGRASRRGRGSRDGALSLACWLRSLRSRASSPGIWLVKSKATRFLGGRVQSRMSPSPQLHSGSPPGSEQHKPQVGPEPHRAMGLLQHQLQVGFRASPFQLLMKICTATLHLRIIES